MSPEQIQGKPRPASDQYSLGVIVYEWLSGDRPFRGSFTELCTQHMFAPPPPLREKISGIAPDVEHVVMTALAKEPKQRFGSIQAFANALEQASQSVSPQANIATVQPTNMPPAQPERSPLPPLARPVEIQQVPLTDNTPYTPSPLPPTAYAPPPVYPRLEQNAPQGPGFPPSQPGSIQNRQKMSAWGINKRQLIAIVLGTVTYAIIEYLLDELISASLFNPIGNLPYLPSPGNVLYGISIIIPLFLGAEFGVWAGVISILAGSLLGDAFAAIISATFWYIYLSLAISGFFSGLTLLRPNSKKPIIRAVTMNAIGLTIGAVVQTIGFAWRAPSTLVPVFSDIMLSNTLLVLLLLPIVLSIYKSITRRKAQAV
jgi:hypothetical protein